MSAEKFIQKYRRNYVNYAALVDVAFAFGTEAENDYANLSHEEHRKVLDFAIDYVKSVDRRKSVEKVWVLWACPEFEGRHLCGVFINDDCAQKAKKRLEEADWNRDEYYLIEHVNLNEITV